MTKDKLLNTLRKMNINNYNDKILDRDEYILKLLLTLDDSLIKIGIDIINLYEDDMARFMSHKYKKCPYFKNGDEYRVVRHQM